MTHKQKQKLKARVENTLKELPKSTTTDIIMSEKFNELVKQVESNKLIENANRLKALKQTHLLDIRSGKPGSGRHF